MTWLKSNSNFLTNLVTLIFSIFIFNGAAIPEEAAGKFVEAFIAENWVELFVVVLINLLNPIYHMFKNKVENFWAFLGSMNFWTNFASLVAMFLTISGVGIPDDAAESVVEAIFSGDWGLVLTTLFLNVINPIIHFAKTKWPKHTRLQDA